MLKALVIMTYLMSHPHGSPADPDAFKLSSPVLSRATAIPKSYTCQGKNVSIPLRWSGTPMGTQSLALIMLDENVPRSQWYHWALFNIPSNETTLPENANPVHGVKAAANSWNHFRYDGPCPPSGTHHYVIRLYALNIRLPNKEKLTTLQLRKAMRGHIISQATLRTRSSAAPEKTQHT